FPIRAVEAPVPLHPEGDGREGVGGGAQLGDGDCDVPPAEAVRGGRGERSARGVGPDLIPLDDVVVAAAAVDGDAVVRAAGDDVPGAGGGPADRVIRGAGVEEHAGVGVEARVGPARVHAEVVPLDQVA